MKTRTPLMRTAEQEHLNPTTFLTANSRNCIDKREDGARVISEMDVGKVIGGARFAEQIDLGGQKFATRCVINKPASFLLFCEKPRCAVPMHDRSGT